MADYPKGTPEMIRFVADVNAENNERNSKREKILGRLRQKRDNIANAIIGIGNGLNSLNQQKTQDVNIKFLKKFGMNMYAINLNPQPTQKEIDETTSKPEEEL